MKKDTKRLRKVADEATFIRCRYCDIKDTCSKRASKEEAESKGFLTYCAITPNKNKKHRKR